MPTRRMHSSRGRQTQAYGTPPSAAEGVSFAGVQCRQAGAQCRQEKTRWNTLSQHPQELAMCIQEDEEVITGIRLSSDSTSIISAFMPCCVHITHRHRRVPHLPRETHTCDAGRQDSGALALSQLCNYSSNWHLVVPSPAEEHFAPVCLWRRVLMQQHRHQHQPCHRIHD